MSWSFVLPVSRDLGAKEPGTITSSYPTSGPILGLFGTEGGLFTSWDGWRLGTLLRCLLEVEVAAELRLIWEPRRLRCPLFPNMP